MNLPTQTAKIFRMLSRGQFISSNSSDKNISELYKVIDAENTFELLSDYYEHIDFILERGDGYFYFSRPESKTTLEGKLRKAYEWIDMLDFFKSFDNTFGVGYRFRPSEILVQLNTNADLEIKLGALGKQVNRKTQNEILDRVLKKLVDDGFIELESEINHLYKVLDAFKYLEQLIMVINIPEEVKNEISK